MLKVQHRFFWFPFALATLVVVSNGHCRAGAAQRLISTTCLASHLTRGESLPIGFPTSGCSNESGCMCRGATTIDNFSVGAVLGNLDGHRFHGSQTMVLPLLFSNSEPILKAGSVGEAPRIPRSGKILRAELSSFLF